MGRIAIGLLVDQIVSGYSRLIVAGVEDWCKAKDSNLVIYVGKVLGSLKSYEYQANVIFEHIGKGAVDALVVASGAQTSLMSPERFRLYIDRFRRNSQGQHRPRPGWDFQCPG